MLSRPGHISEAEQALRKANERAQMKWKRQILQMDLCGMWGMVTQIDCVTEPITFLFNV
jgi:hypothetical protein